MKSKTGWARELISAFQKQKILILGDLMLDRYIYGTVTRISPEAPVPVVRVMNEKNMPGGAANVARNIQSLGGYAILSGIVGEDDEGKELMVALTEEGVHTNGVILHPDIRTTVKTRILAEHQQVVRVDWDYQMNLPDDALQAYSRKNADLVLQGEVSGVIIEDYGRGSVFQEVVDAVLAAAKQQGIPVALDPREGSDLRINGMTVATPDRKEAFSLARVPGKQPEGNPLHDEALLRVADILLDQWNLAFLMITLGAQGMLLASKGHKPRHIHTVAREVFDVSGAGDTVIATTLLALAAGGKNHQAAELANCAAGVVVGKVGTADCARNELLARI